MQTQERHVAKPALDPTSLRANAAKVAEILGAIANERRLQILCRLVMDGEATVTGLADGVGLSQSATSQHLARMRDEGLVAFRRESQTLWYRITDPRIEQLFATLQRLYCATPEAPQPKE